MKVILRNILLVSLLGLLVNCNEDEVTSRNYPRLKTLPVSEITMDGAKFNAEIIFRGDFKVINYGFVWGPDENPNLNNDDRVLYSENLQEPTFSAHVNRSLKEGATFYVRAFIETDEFIVYAQSIEFVSLGGQPPKITGLSPVEGTIGDTLNIIGSNFSDSRTLNKVKVDNLDALVISSSDSLLKIIVPYKLRSSSSKISATLFGNKTTSNQRFILSSPLINSINPDQGSDSTKVLISGNGFSIVPELNIVNFDDISAQVLTSCKNQIEVLIPAGLKNEKVELSVIVADQAEVSDQFFSMLPPRIMDFQPKEATCGGSIIIEGENFGSEFGSVQVFFNEQEARILNSNSKRIEVSIPSGLDDVAIIKVIAFEQENSHNDLFIPNLALPSIPNDGLIFFAPFANSVKPAVGSTGFGIEFVRDRNNNDNQALYIDGTRNFLLDGGDNRNNETFALGNHSEFTLSFWMKSDTHTDQIILCRQDLSSLYRHYYAVSLENKRISFIIFKDGTVESDEISTNTTQGWHFYAWTYKNQSISVYIDGHMKLSKNFSFPIKYDGSAYGPSTLIGGCNSSGLIDTSFSGSIDQIRIYDRKLSEEEIFNLYINESCE